jgi:UDP:flavonoid glycosyltransferase YjiC (YdhE family)
MRILFTFRSTEGHFHPLVPIARAAERAGHEVVFATQAQYAAPLQHSGFRAFPTRTFRSDTVAFPELRSLQGDALVRFILRYIWSAETAQMAVDLLDIIERWRPDLIVRESSEFGACIVAERLGIPYAVVEILAAGYTPEWQASISAGLADVLAEHGLPPDPGLRIAERQLVLNPFPPRYQREGGRTTGSPRFSIRPTPFDQSGDEGMPAWIDRLPTRPTAFLTLGTGSHTSLQTAIFEAFIKGLAEEPLNLIVAVGRNNDPTAFGSLPPNVWIERYVPQTLVFPRCDVVICHAGSGSVMAALTHGLPLVLVPNSADQPQNAGRCAELEVARVLDWVTLDPMIARAAVRDVLSTSSYRQSAEKLRAEIEALPGPEQAVTILERLVADQELVLKGR